MYMKKIKFLAIFLFQITFAQTELVNILDSNYYGFEITSGDTGWWIQHPDNFSLVNDKASNGSLGSLKYTSATTVSGNKRIFGSKDITAMLVTLEPGTYPVKAMVWLENDVETSHFKLDFREDTTVKEAVTFSLDGIAKGQWVEVSTNLVLTETLNQANIRVIVEPGFGGKGTFYIDDLQILVEQEVVPVKVPLQSFVLADIDSELGFTPGEYEISLNVWLEENTTVSSFYTFVTNPWVATEWVISELPTGEWVKMTKQIILKEKPENAQLKIATYNNPDFQGGKGVFYVDDVLVSQKTDTLSIPEEVEDTEVIFYPNPASDYLTMTENVPVEIYNSFGMLVRKIIPTNENGEVVLDVSFLKNGIYYFRIVSENSVAVKTIIIQ